MIAVLNLAGISYGYWNDGMNIKASISTGKIEPYISDFEHEYKLVGNDKDEYFNVDVDPDPENPKIIIDARVSSEYNDNLFIKLSNRGTVPVAFKRLEKRIHDGIIKQIKVPDEGAILAEDNEEEVHILIHANQQDLGLHTFKYELIFDQWNK